MPEVVLKGKILKLNDEKQIIYGWANVNTQDGTLVIDSQGDRISDEELTKAAHDFMEDSRKGGFMHLPGIQTGNVVESVVLTKNLQDALGIVCKDKDGRQITGWFIGYHVINKKLWEHVKAGDFREFSIGGEGVRANAE